MAIPLPDGAQIYSATYSGVPVYELRYGADSVMRRRLDDYINATHILKAAGLDKPARTRILEREVQKDIHQKVQGGYGKYQGTWIPIDKGRELAARNNVLDKIAPIFDFVAGGTSPPPVPKGAGSKPRASRTSTGPAGTGTGRKRGGGNAGSRRTTSTPILKSTTVQGMLQSQQDPYMTMAPEQAQQQTITPGIPVGYMPAQGHPRRFYENEGDSVVAASLASAASMLERETRGGQQVGDEEDINASRELDVDDEDDDDDEDEYEYDYGYGVGNGPDGRGHKRKRNPKLDHTARGFGEAAQEIQQEERYYLHPFEQQHVLQSQHQQQQEAQQADIEAREAVERERLHTMYSDQLLDYFMTVGDSPHRELCPPLPPPTFEVDRPVDDKGNTALHWACAMGDIPIVRDLISRGADVGVRTNMDETPLIRAVLFTNNFEKRTMPALVDLLAETLTLRDWYGATVFNHLAATTQARGKWRAAKYYAQVLLEKMSAMLPAQEIRQVLSSVDFEGDTAALKAARNGCTKLAKMLLSRAPEAWDLRSKNGESAREVLDRVRRRKEGRNRERDEGLGFGSGMGMNMPPSSFSMSSQYQRIDPQLSAAAVEAVHNVDAHTHAQAQAEAEQRAREEAEAQAQAAQEHMQAQAQAQHVGMTVDATGHGHIHRGGPEYGANPEASQRPITPTRTPTATAPAAPKETDLPSPPTSQILNELAPVLDGAFRKLATLFGANTPVSKPTTAVSGVEHSSSADTTISDPQALYEHLESERASIRKQIATLKAQEEEASKQHENEEAWSLEAAEEEYGGVRAAYEGLVERVQEKELKARIERAEDKESEDTENKDGQEKDDAARLTMVYAIVQQLARAAHARRQKVQDLIDGRADAGAVTDSNTSENDGNGNGNIQPVNPNLRVLVATATGLKESELDEMAAELEATLSFERLGAVDVREREREGPAGHETVENDHERADRDEHVPLPSHDRGGKDGVDDVEMRAVEGRPTSAGGDTVADGNTLNN